MMSQMLRISDVIGRISEMHKKLISLLDRQLGNTESKTTTVATDKISKRQ